jgi:hypothetical protein
MSTNKNTEKKVVKKSQTKSNSEKNVSVTDDKMINEILGNMGKKSKNPVKKELINNFVDGKKKYDIKKQTTSKSVIEDDEKDDKSVGKKTFTDNLTKEEINEKLEDYKLVEDISKVPLGTHLRYFVEKDGTKLFRMGGNLKRNLDLPNFVVLQNAVGVEWTVQIKNTTFYKKMTIKEIKEEYDGIIEDLHDKIKKLKAENKELKAENKELKKK